jgi:hypothetical protein
MFMNPSTIDDACGSIAHAITSKGLNAPLAALSIHSALSQLVVILTCTSPDAVQPFVCHRLGSALVLVLTHSTDTSLSQTALAILARILEGASDVRWLPPHPAPFAALRRASDSADDFLTCLIVRVIVPLALDGPSLVARKFSLADFLRHAQRCDRATQLAVLDLTSAFAATAVPGVLGGAAPALA